MYSYLGKDIEAKKCFKKILTIRPNWPIAHRHLSLVTNYQTDTTHIQELKLLLEKDLRPEDEIQIRYAYFRANSAKGKINEAYYSLKKSKKLRKSLSNYQIKNELKIFEKVKAFYSFSIKTKPRIIPTSNDLKPIFIVGMPRSGTTLVEQILGSHTKALSGGEIPFLGRELYPRFSKINPPVNAFSQPFYNDLYKKYQKLIPKVPLHVEYFIDKMPTNFLWIGIINKVFPNFKIINVSRDPMAVVWSNYKHYFSSRELGFSNCIDDIISYYDAYKNLMSFWKVNFSFKIFDLNYDKLTLSPETEIQKLLEFCNLRWEESCLNFHENKEIIQTASRSQVKKPIYKGSSDDWKKYQQHLTDVEKKVRSTLNI